MLQYVFTLSDKHEGKREREGEREREKETDRGIQ